MSDTPTSTSTPSSPIVEGGPSSPLGEAATSLEVDELVSLLERSFKANSSEGGPSEEDTSRLEEFPRPARRARKKRRAQKAGRLSQPPGERPPSRGGVGRARPGATPPRAMADALNAGRAAGQAAGGQEDPPAGAAGPAGHDAQAAGPAAELPAEPPQGADPDVVLAWANDMCATGTCRLSPPQLLRIIRILNETHVSRDDVIQQATLMQYQGFDPIKTAAKMLEIKQQKQVTSEQFRADIVTLCVLFLTRGTNIPSIVKKMGDEGKARVLGLEQRYSVKKGQRAPEEITVPRVALTFYKVTVLAAHHLGEMLPLSRTQMQALCAGYPAGMMTQAFAAAIPRGVPYELVLFHAHGLFLFHFAKVINPDLRSKGDMAVKDSFLPAYRAAMSKRDAERAAQNVALLVTLGVLLEDAATHAITVSPAVEAAAMAFIQKFGPVSIDA